MSDIGNSNRITREYLDSLLIETRFMDSAANPDTGLELYGQHISSPIMTAPISHLNHWMFPGAADALAKGAKAADAVLWYGMADEEEIDSLAAYGGTMIEIIKTYDDRDLIYKKIEHAEKLGMLAVGIDIDHPFGSDGSPDIVDGYKMTPLRTAELMEITKATRLPLIIKGVLSLHDAERALAAGAQGLVVSHHNNRIEYAVPPLMVLPEIAELVNGSVPIFVDCEIRTGMDAFKALCLGATGVCIGRPLMTAIKQDPENGVRDYLLKANDELKKAMAFTGCVNLSKMDPTIVRTLW